MNRAQRRQQAQASRQTAKRRHDPMKAWGKIQFSMLANRAVPLTDAQLQDFDARVERCLNGLQYGTMEDADYIDIIRLPIYGVCLMDELKGHDETGQIADQEKVFLRASEALTNIGQRQQDIGSFIAQADELAILKEARWKVYDMLKICYQSHSFRAANAAGKMIARNYPRVRL